MTEQMTAAHDTARLRALAAEARWLVMSTVSAKKAGHVGGPLSAMDLLVVLYFGALRIDPSQPSHPDRDRFILSKGHNSIALYAVMALRGFFDVTELETFDQGDSRLQGHPDALRLQGLDASTGSLGQGLAVGVGMALAAKRADKDFLTWVLLGDGEHQEGMVWESVLCARRYSLDNLVAIVDRNGLQQYGWPLDGMSGSRFDRLDPWAGVDLAGVYRAFGWNVLEIDGHDIEEIGEALEAPRRSLAGSGRPTVVLAATTKGKGISFTEGRYKWHNGVADDAQLAQARRDLGLGTKEES